MSGAIPAVRHRCYRAPVSRVSKIAGALALIVLLSLGGGLGLVTWGIASPSEQHLPLSPALVSLESDEGRALRDRAVDRADLDGLTEHFEAQIHGTYCGVASSVIALNALQIEATQQTFFDGPASDVRSGWATFYTGMTVEQLGGLLAAHGAHTQVTHAGDSSLDAFRAAARRNLSQPGDVLLVNYLRSAIDQESAGHISPLAAYDEETDRFLVLDVSTYKYPPVWVRADALYGAMNTLDSASGETRGWVAVSR